MATFAGGRRLEGEVNKLELVDLISELDNEDLVEAQA